jgi:UMF1 family MFS transporter
MVKKREIFGFSLFDFANSAYTTVIITAIYNAFFVKVIGTPFLWSITLSLSYLFVLLISPVAGAMADFQGRKKRFLFFAYILCITFTALLFFSSREHLIRTMIFIILSNLGFALSEIFVSSFLPEISTKENIGRISGYAWSFGYVGGIASLICCLGYLSITGYGDTAVRATTLVTAVFFTIFAMPCFFLLKERKKGESLPPGQHLLTVGFNRLINTYREIRQYRELFKFLAAFFFYTCGTVTVISFAAIYAQGVLLFSRQETILLIIVANVTSAVGAFIFGYIQDRIGAKSTILITLVLWLSAVLGVYFIKEKTSFWVIANLVGFAMGAIQSASRSLIGLFSPVHKSAEFYGFWGFSGKAAAIVGLFSFGALLKLFNGDMRQAVLFTSLFFIIGFLMMLRIHPNKGVNT